ncbi:MAG: M56 family metallopeptidase [Bacteroidales bacterium]|nr:M56 family metallopeptidase [Bacteroidales bacterium]
MMTELFLYSIKSAFALVLLYAPYALLLHREKCLGRNRLTLLAILGLSLLLPLCNISSWSMDNQPLVHQAQMQMIEAGIPIHTAQDEAETVEAQAELELGATHLSAKQNPTWTEGTPVVPAADATEEPASHDWFQIVSILFAIGMTLVLGVRLAQFCRMGVVIRRGSLWQEKVNGIRIYCHSEQVTPFSWLNNIVIGDKDYDRNGREIILHEEGHIRHCHSLDIVLLTLVQMLQWWNPFVFLLARHLRDVHEYEADDYVLRHDIDPQAYQMLLLQSVVHDATFPLASSFNHSLIKNRIKMMSLPQPKAWLRSKMLYVIPLSMLALSVFATPSIIEPIEKTVATLEQACAPEESNPVTKDFDPEEQIFFEYTQTIKGRTYKKYAVRIPKGTWIVSDKGKSYINEVGVPFSLEFERPFYLQGLTDSTIIKIDGVVYDRDSLPKRHYSEIKKAEFQRNPQAINLITKNVIVPDTVKDNVPRVQTVILPGKNHVIVVDSLWIAGDWSYNKFNTSWEDKKEEDFSFRKWFFFTKRKPDLKVYIQASTEATQAEIDRAVGILNELGIKNYEITKDIPIYHWTDDQYRAWAEKQKALGVKYSVSALKAKLKKEYVDITDMDDMRRWNRVIRPVFKPEKPK